MPTTPFYEQQIAARKALEIAFGLANAVEILLALCLLSPQDRHDVIDYLNALDGE